MTEFGIALRVIRMKRGERLKDMACALKVTSSFLSAVENGKKSIPLHWIDTLTDLYHLDTDEVKELEAAFAETNAQMSKELRLNLETCDYETRALVFSFARNFSKLSAQDLMEIRQILSRVE